MIVRKNTIDFSTEAPGDVSASPWDCEGCRQGWEGETADAISRSACRGWPWPPQPDDRCTCASERRLGKRAVSLGASSQCCRARGCRNLFSCPSPAKLLDQNRRGKAGEEQPSPGPGFLLCALNQPLQASGYSAAPPRSGPKKKSVS